MAVQEQRQRQSNPDPSRIRASERRELEQELRRRVSGEVRFEQVSFHYEGLPPGVAPALPTSGGGRHFGSRLRFGPNGRLFISRGDRGDRHRAQDPGDHLRTPRRTAEA